MKKLLSTRTNNGLRYKEMTKVSHKRVLNFDKKEIGTFSLSFPNESCLIISFSTASRF